MQFDNVSCGKFDHEDVDFTEDGLDEVEEDD